MKKFIILLIIFFAGFLTHAFWFPNFLISPQNVTNNVKTILGLSEQKKQSSSTAESNEFITYINYLDGKFNRTRVNITRGNYIAITNMSKTESMLLVSDNSALSTPRGYGYSERLMTILLEPGNYTVVNKNKPDAVVTVSVR
jgi:hypothetical protein